MMIDDVRLSCFEILESFVDHLRAHYHEHKNIEIYHDGAENMMKHINP